jgi:hypothetical protein
MNWQDYIALGIVAVAAAYLARRAWLVVARRKSAGCGGCGTCAAGSTGDAKKLVTIGGVKAIDDRPSSNTDSRAL